MMTTCKKEKKTYTTAPPWNRNVMPKQPKPYTIYTQQLTWAENATPPPEGVLQQMLLQAPQKNWWP